MPNYQSMPNWIFLEVLRNEISESSSTMVKENLSDLCQIGSIWRVSGDEILKFSSTMAKENLSGVCQHCQENFLNAIDELSIK